MLLALIVLCYGQAPTCSCFEADRDGDVWEYSCFYDETLDEYNDQEDVVFKYIDAPQFKPA